MAISDEDGAAEAEDACASEDDVTAAELLEDCSVDEVLASIDEDNGAICEEDGLPAEELTTNTLLDGCGSAEELWGCGPLLGDEAGSDAAELAVLLPDAAWEVPLDAASDEAETSPLLDDVAPVVEVSVHPTTAKNPISPANLHNGAMNTSQRAVPRDFRRV